MKKIDMTIDTYQKYLIAGSGIRIDVNDYLDYHKNCMHFKAEKKMIPKEYEFPLGMQLELSSKCNQKCIHCYNQSNDSKHNNLLNELSIEEWKAIARQAVDMKIFQCVISGGEPTLLGDDLFEIMDILHQGGS